MVELNDCSKERKWMGSHSRQRFPGAHQPWCPGVEFGFCSKCNDSVLEGLTCKTRVIEFHADVSACWVRMGDKKLGMKSERRV